MIWLKKFPSVSIFLLLLAYGVEGWLYGAWASRLLETGNLYANLVDETRFAILYCFAVTAIVLCVIIFTSPISLVELGLDNWLKSDLRAFLSIFFGAFAFTIVVQKVDYFARFLVYVASALLLKLDLQLLGYNRWLCSIILSILCWLGFTGGILAFYFWS